ncbi:MAG: YncE family protein [Patescibacteria group bacterium]
MPNKYYLIISLALISLIGIYSMFNAGYNPEEDFKPDRNEETILEQPKLEETILKKRDQENEENEEVEDNSNDKEESDSEEVKTSAGVKEIKLHSDNEVECLYKIENITSPKSLAFRPNKDDLWVASLMNRDYGVVVFNTEDGKRKKEIKLPDGGGVEIEFNQDGSLAYVSQMETGRVFEIDAETKEVKETYKTNGDWTKVVKLSKNNLFASNWSSNDISKINLENSSVEKIQTTQTPRGIHISGDYLYVAGFADGEIRKHNLKNNTSETLISTGGAMRDLLGTENYVYASDMASQAVYRINKETDEVQEFAETDNNPNTIRLTKEKEILIVSNRGVNHESGNYNIPGPEWGTILFFDAENGKLLEAIVAGNQPTGLDVSNELFAFSNFLDNEIIICKTPNYDSLKENPSQRVENYKKEIKK